MTPMALARIAQWTHGRLLGDDLPIDAVATDTRTLDARDRRATLFVALKGERFDGHDHVAAAADRGARAALVSREVDAPLPQVVVADTERALAALASAMQRSRTTRVVGITGSNGKTSVKQLVHAIAARSLRAYANPGNRNNEIGLPLAVIDAPEDAEVAVYEMGAGKPGDIAYLTAIARPDVALVNNIAPAHLERMHSLLGIADTKAAVYDALPHDGVAVINADDAFAPYFAERAHGRRLLRFGLEASADVTARAVSSDADGSRFVLVAPTGEVDVVLPLPGRHNVSNALAAASIALALGIPLEEIAAALGDAQPVKGRLVQHRLAGGAVLIDDSYNANPGSLNAAIDTLASGGGEAWLVLGDMRELGGDARDLHAEAGRRARRAGLARVYALGPLSAAAAEAFGEGGRHFDHHDALAAALAADLHPGVRMLVKGSRGSAMDRIVDALLARATGEHDAA
ncbi:UDP-N-acetylmuramoyl-tripeptide--D-alanyl-D-alanine ligase [Luteimonas composti]|uniref:UDP-N-acetylmuramoyl-tripeptide--D-alanyl-D-alanine ligase n=1 Tax=Luteimonas composti TaxID=398257 RepID=A0ABT6MP36_9GAMM|nr:UDP-N-acetylmuramoyl-tripeptide--D-alanyl-D-alanine ligase [Luteimonas composti]MDH7452370.1 UDP-N-acetylmuramoyl-tripeptide--D-alanyl-D-alanine ligase [Luteimonas composti]